MSCHSDHKHGATFGFVCTAERLNGRLAMLGFVVAIGTYLTTGQIIPGLL